MQKVLFFIVSLLTVTAMAKTDCVESAYQIAEMNLKQKHEALQFHSSSITDEEPSEIKVNSKKGTETMTFEGNIHKATFKIDVEVGEACDVVSVKIEENL